jgi:hypothetical protein
MHRKHMTEFNHHYHYKEHRKDLQNHCAWWCLVGGGWIGTRASEMKVHESVCLHLPLGLRLCLLWAALPLLVLCAPAGRFVSGLTLSSPHCVSCTVICGCVFCGHRAQLQGELVLRCVSGDGDAALEGWVVACASSRIYVSHPLQAFPWGLADPAPSITADWVTRDSTGEGQSLWGLHQSWSWFLQLHLGQDTWRKGES